MSKKWRRRIVYGVAALAAVALAAVAAAKYLQGSTLRDFTDGKLVAADYWTEKPEILSAGFGFDSIIGLPEITKDEVRAAGGSWHGALTCANGEEPGDTVLTSAAAASTIQYGYKGYADHDDGLPIVFSWPVATETVDPTDFRLTTNTGETVIPHAAGMNPNWEDNERNTVVTFGEFGNRTQSTEPGARFTTKLEIVADDTPLTLIGPGGKEISAVGLTWTTKTSPYDSGPKLVGAKLNRVGAEPEGEGGTHTDLYEQQSGYMPNDEFALYGGGDFRLRTLTTGGFSPDGVTGLRPDMYEDFFRIHAKGPDGRTILMTKTGVDYELAGGTLRIVGLSDLGRTKSPEDGIYYDDCYEEDGDNYIDVILDGDEAAGRNITAIEIPSLEGGYHSFYNPGGPGPEPFDGVRYTAPGPPDLEAVTIALDDPMRVDRNP